jgi:hypothetical protein
MSCSSKKHNNIPELDHYPSPDRLRNRFAEDCERVLNKLKEQSLSGDTQASKVFLEFMNGKYEPLDVEISASLNLNDEQAKKIADLVQKQI